jgi:predicted GIY-YIG superfamily endonuclease
MPRLPRPPLATGTVQLPALGQTYVYRAYCRCGDLLYVGITSNLFDRVVAHRRAQAGWEPKAARLEWDLHPNRADAERAETYMIATLHPTYNRLGRNGRNRHWVPLPELAPPPSLDERAFAAHRALALGDRF